jgi:ribosomal protein L37E
MGKQKYPNTRAASTGSPSSKPHDPTTEMAYEQWLEKQRREKLNHRCIICGGHVPDSFSGEDRKCSDCGYNYFQRKVLS